MSKNINILSMKVTVIDDKVTFYGWSPERNIQIRHSFPAEHVGQIYFDMMRYQPISPMLGRFTIGDLISGEYTITCPIADILIACQEFAFGGGF